MIGLFKGFFMIENEDKNIDQNMQLSDEQKHRIWKVYQDLIDYMEHFIIMRNNSFSVQLTIFFNSLIIGFVICVNHHIQLPFPHFLGASILIFTGVFLYLSFFNSSFFVQRRWLLSVAQVSSELLRKYPLTLRSKHQKNYYSCGGAFPELILFAVLLFTAILSFSLWISSSEAIIILVNIFSVSIIFLICCWMSHKIRKDEVQSLSWNSDLLLEIPKEEFENTWNVQLNYIKRMKFINSSLSGIKKTLITFAIISPLILLGDLLLKNFELNRTYIPIYGFAVSFLAQAPILSIWYFYMIKTQKDAQVIFIDALELEQNHHYIPPLWHSILSKCSPKSAVIHMSTSYIVSLISILFLGLSFIVFCDLEFVFKSLLVLFSCFVSVVVSTYIIKKSWPK